MKKFLVGFFAVLMFLSVHAFPAYAAAPVSASSIPTIGQQRNEETVWYTRWYEGREQKRLWSITRGIWLTDWIDC